MALRAGALGGGLRRLQIGSEMAGALDDAPIGATRGLFGKSLAHECWSKPALMRANPADGQCDIDFADLAGSWSLKMSGLSGPVTSRMPTRPRSTRVRA